MTNAASESGAIKRGATAVRSALIEAACEMLAEIGPNAMTVRSVADKARVNHGQVHHYFGGKTGLIEAATTKLAEDHYRNARERSNGAELPEPLTVGEDSQYLKAIVRLVLDGRLDIAVKELESGQSVPVEARRSLTKEFRGQEIPIEFKARFAVAAAIELGWAALEPYILRVADVSEAEQEAVLDRAKILSRSFSLNTNN